MKDGDTRRRQLERIAVAGGDKCPSFAPGFCRGGGGEEVVSLVPGFLGTGEAAGRDEFREDLQLLDQFVVELAAALIGGKQSLAVCRGAERVPADQYGARTLTLVQPQQEIGEADDGAATVIPSSPDRFGQGVVGAVGEVVAVDDEQGASGFRHNSSSTVIGFSAFPNLMTC